MSAGPFHSPATHSLRYDQVRFKASHNSYAKKVSLEEQLTFNRDHPHRRGFRGLELDVHQDRKGCKWCVRHLIGNCARLHANRRKTGRGGPDCLGEWFGELATWSGANPGHDVITLTLDLKRVVRRDTFGDDFDELLSSAGLDATRLFSPGELTGPWPTLGELSGKFIACLSGLEKVKADYAARGGGLCFSDVAMGPGRRRKRGEERLFLNYNWREYEKGQGNVFRPPQDRAYVIRAYNLRKDVALGSWDVAERKGVNIMSTDWLRRLAVGSEPFVEI